MAINSIITELGVAKVVDAIDTKVSLYISGFSVADTQGTLDGTRTKDDLQPTWPIAENLHKRPVTSSERVDSNTMHLTCRIPPAQGEGEIQEVQEIYLFVKTSNNDVEVFIEPLDINTQTNGIRTSRSWETGERIVFTTTGTLPEPLQPDTVYYAIRISANEIKIAGSASDAEIGAAVNLLTEGTGLHTLRVTEYFSNTDVDTVADTINTQLEWADGIEVVVESTGNLPDPLVAGTNYFVIKEDDDKIKLALTKDDALNGTAIDLTSAGSGVMNISPYEFLFSIGQPEQLIPYYPTGSTSFRIALTFANADPSRVIHFNYSQTTEITDHNSDITAHAIIQDGLKRHGIHLQKPIEPYYNGQAYDEFAIFQDGIQTGQIVRRDIDGTYHLAIDDGTDRAKWVGFADIENNIVYKSGFISRTHGYAANTTLYLHNTIAGDLTDQPTRTIVGMAIDGDTISINDEVANPIEGNILSNVLLDADVLTGDLVYLDVLDGIYYRAIDDGTNKAKWIGVADRERNQVIFNNFTAIPHGENPGTELFLSTVNPGKTTTAQGQVPVGVAITQDLVALRDETMDIKESARITNVIVTNDGNGTPVDGDLVYIQTDGTYSKATSGDESAPEKASWVGVYDATRKQVIVGGYASIDRTATAGTQLFLSDSAPGKCTEEDTGHPVGISKGGNLIFLKGDVLAPEQQLTIPITSDTHLGIATNYAVVYKSSGDAKYYAAISNGGPESFWCGVADKEHNKIVSSGLINLPSLIGTPNNSLMYLSSSVAGELTTSKTDTYVGLYISDGDLIVGGGPSNASGTLNAFSDIDSTSPTTGSITTAGGLGVAKAVHVGSEIETVSPTTGALVVAGGIASNSDIRAAVDLIAHNNVVATEGLFVRDYLIRTTTTQVGINVPNATNLQENFHINNGIYLGIPDTSGGSIKTSQNLITSFGSDPNSQDFYFGILADTTELLRVWKGGNVSINTTDNTYKLDVNGTFHVQELATFSNGIHITEGTGGITFDGTMTFDGRVDVTQILTVGTDTLTVNMGTADRIGVNNSDPFGTFHVLSDGVFYGLVVEQTTGGRGILVHGTADAPTDYLIRAEAGSEALDTDNIKFSVRANGHVYVGDLLEVEGDVLMHVSPTTSNPTVGTAKLYVKDGLVNPTLEFLTADGGAGSGEIALTSIVEFARDYAPVFDGDVQDKDIVYKNATGNYSRARADQTTRSKWVGIADTFDPANHRVHFSGSVYYPGHGHDEGTHLFLSATNYGAITSEITESPLGIVIDANHILLQPSHRPKATQADAQLGTDNSKYMTPLRTFEAIAQATTNTQSEGTTVFNAIQITEDSGLLGLNVEHAYSIFGGHIEIIDPDHSQIKHAARNNHTPMTGYQTYHSDIYSYFDTFDNRMRMFHNNPTDGLDSFLFRSFDKATTAEGNNESITWKYMTPATAYTSFLNFADRGDYSISCNDFTVSNPSGLAATVDGDLYVTNGHVRITSTDDAQLLMHEMIDAQILSIDSDWASCFVSGTRNRWCTASDGVIYSYISDQDKANSTEALLGLDDKKYMTAAMVKVATDNAIVGQTLVKAENADIDTGTDDDKYMTPLKTIYAIQEYSIANVGMATLEQLQVTINDANAIEATQGAIRLSSQTKGYISLRGQTAPPPMLAGYSQLYADSSNGELFYIAPSGETRPVGNRLTATTDIFRAAITDSAANALEVTNGGFKVTTGNAEITVGTLTVGSTITANSGLDVTNDLTISAGDLSLTAGAISLDQTNGTNGGYISLPELTVNPALLAGSAKLFINSSSQLAYLRDSGTVILVSNQGEAHSATTLNLSDSTSASSKITGSLVSAGGAGFGGDVYCAALTADSFSTTGTGGFGQLVTMSNGLTVSSGDTNLQHVNASSITVTNASIFNGIATFNNQAWFDGQYFNSISAPTAPTGSDLIVYQNSSELRSLNVSGDYKYIHEGDKASTGEATSATSNDLYMTPATVRDAIDDRVPQIEKTKIDGTTYSFSNLASFPATHEFSVIAGNDLLSAATRVESDVVIGSDILETDNDIRFTVAIGTNIAKLATPSSVITSNVLIGNELASAITTGGLNSTVNIGFTNFASATASEHDVLVGYYAGYNYTSASQYNTFIGDNSGTAITSGQGNTMIGAFSEGEPISSNSIAIGYGATAPVSTQGLSIGNAIIADMANHKYSFGWATLPANNDTIHFNQHLIPRGHQAWDLGISGAEWENFYVHTVIESSDLRKKKDVQNVELGLDFIDRLRPVTYQWKDREEMEPEYVERQKFEVKEVEVEDTEIVEIDGKWVKKKITRIQQERIPMFKEVPLYDEEGNLLEETHRVPLMEKVLVSENLQPTNNVRRHYGLIAQEVEEVLKDLGIPTKDFAPLVIGDNGDYALRYTQLIPILIKSIKELKGMINK